MSQANALRVVESTQQQDSNEIDATNSVPTASVVEGEISSPVNDEAENSDNIVRRSVQEFCELHKEMHNLRENLIALGVPAQTVTVLVEMGFNGRLTEQEKLMNSCLEEACGGHVEDSILSRFKMQLQELTNLERDMAHARKIARESGLVLPALNALTQMIRQNPGDNGEKVINSFLAYAIAAGIPMTKVEDILKTATEKPKSVLPVIERDDSKDASKARLALWRDIAIGLVISFFLMWLMT